MSYKNYMRSTIVVVVSVFALGIFSALAPGALLAPQTATNPNSKPSQKQPASPTRSSVVVKPTNSNKVTAAPTATNAKPSQKPVASPSSPAVLKRTKSTNGSLVLMSPTEPSKLKNSTISAAGLHQYVIIASDSELYHQVAVRVLNAGKGPATAGLVYAELVVLEQGGDPRKSKILFIPGEIIDFLSWPQKTQPYSGSAELPSLKPGETADVYIKFDKVVHPEELKMPSDVKWTMGIRIYAHSNKFMADGRQSAYLHDFLSLYGFYNP